MNHITKWGALATLMIVTAIGIAVCAGALDLNTAVSGVALAEGALAVKLTELEAAMKQAFDAMGVNIRKVQDTATQALEESKKHGDRIEAETNKKLTELGEAGNTLAADFKAVRDQVLELAQKMATKPQGGSGDEQKSMYDIIVASPEWKAASSKPNARSMEPVVIGNFHRHWSWQAARQFWNTQITNPNPLSNDNPLVPAQRIPGIITPPQQRLFIRDLIPAATTDQNLIEFAKEATFTNNARPQGDVSPVGHGEGEQKAESALSFSLSSAPVVTIAHWIPASRQVLADAMMLQGYIGSRLIYGLKLEEEQEMLTGVGAAGELNGINNQADAFAGGVTNATILDTLLRALLQVSLSNFEASGFILHPIDWYNAMMLKDTQNRYLFSNPQEMVQPRVWAKPVVASQSQTLNRFTAGAFDLGAQIWDREDANVRVSENVNDHFIRNLVAILAEERVALTVYRPSAFCYGSTTYAG